MALMDSYPAKRGTLNPEDALTVHRPVGQIYDPAIMAYRPQRTSLPPSSRSWDSADFFAASRPESNLETRRSSMSSIASFGSSHSTLSTTQTTATSVGSRRSSFINLKQSVQQRSRSTQPPPPVFKRLPAAIYECILQQLTIIHSERYIQSCSTCYLRDLYNLALTSRAWDRAVRVQLYDSIPIHGPDSAAHIKKYKMKLGVRLKLLRRTLRERRVLAQYVHELQVPRLLSDKGEHTTELIDIVASVVMACPNLERLVGFHPTYNHTFNRLAHALSTRHKLKERVWIIDENNEITNRSQLQLPPGLMDMAQASSFIQAHDAWTSLTTLFLHARPNAVLEHDIFISVFERLPSLTHLAISSFDIDDFNDDTLMSVPPLIALRLESLPGLTSNGLSRFVSSLAATPLRSVSLLDLNIDSVLLLSKLFTSLNYLTRFTFAQENCPLLDTSELIFQPLLASNTLTHLHWDILNAPEPSEDHLAHSIRANGFPALRTLRAPSDPHGSLQVLCKPRPQITLPSDKYKGSSAPTSAMKNPHSLHTARAAAQARLEAARNTTFFKVVVDEGGLVSQIYDFPGFMGTIGSKVEHLLRSDVPGGEAALAEWGDLGGRGEKAREGCTGLWNASHAAGKKWWWHGERERTRVVELERFF